MGLKQAGYITDHAENGEDGLLLATTESYDAAVIDIMLPKLDGLSVVEKIREKDDQMPIIILSAKKTVDDRILGLEKGSDDYLTKPFSFSELLARLQALVRRATRSPDSTVLTVDDATPIEVGDKVWITGTGALDGEICNVADVTGNMVTITSETRASADTGLKYDYAGAEKMYVVYRAGNRILHGIDGDHSAGSAKDSVRYEWAHPKLIEANGGMIMRMANASDDAASSFDVRAIYED